MDEAVRPQYGAFFLYLFLILLAVSGFTFFFSRGEQKEQKPVPTESSPDDVGKKTYFSAPQMSIDAKKTYTAHLVTSKGDIDILLFSEEVPRTVNNFVFLSREGFYDGTVFHRIIKDFMIQGGDPKGDGTGSPGYTFDDEPIVRDYDRGVVAMANSGPDTNGSQFFIVHKTTALPKNYVIFAEVTDGMETVDALADVPTEMNETGEKSKPTEDVRIESVRITEMASQR